jgi:cobyrinic acid a,c-diamide synthase
MCAQRLVVGGLEPGPAVGLAAGALLAAFADRATARPVLIGLDVPLWRLLYDADSKPPRVLDPALHGWPLAAELYDWWAEGVDLVVFVAAEPVLDRWQGAEGSRALDVAARFDAPLVLVLDARERGPTAAAGVLGVRALARRAELAGVIVVGGDDRSPAGELGALLRDEVGLPVLGWIPPQLSEQYAREQAVPAGVRQLGPRPATGSAQRLCREAATYLQADEIDEAARRSGYLPSAERRVLLPAPVATGLSLAVAWGPPLQPLALENIDALQASGVTLTPLHVSRDRELPPDVSGLYLAGRIDEDQLQAFAANKALHAALATAIADGLPTLAVGGGALLLLRRLADSRGRSHDLAGVLPAEAELLEWYERPRYVQVRTAPGNPFDEGEGVAHELFDLEFLVLEREACGYEVLGEGEAQGEGFAVGRCLATTLYLSLPVRPQLTRRFLETMRAVGPLA